MLSDLQVHGTSRAVILTDEMLNYLGVEQTVEVTLEAGRVVISAPIQNSVQTHPQNFDDAVDSTISQYDIAFANLAK